MDDAPEGLSIGVYFTQQKEPEVFKIAFKVRPPVADEDFDCFLKKNKSDVGKTRFEWSSGTIGFILALLDYKLKGAREYKFEGSRATSPAASACAALDKQKWLKEAFGEATHTNRDIAKRVFTVDKAPDKPTIAFQIDSDLLPPRNIQIFYGDLPNPLSEQQIRELYEAIEASWKPHHSRKPKASGPTKKPDSTRLTAMPSAIQPKASTAASNTNQAASSVHRTKLDFAKPAGPHDEAATQSDKPANWVRRQREQELSLAKVMVTKVVEKIKSQRWDEAAAQCQIAEKLFAGANFISGVIECRVQLSAIHSHLGWKSANLDWLLETVKLAVAQGSPNQIVRCLADLAWHLPDSIPEESAKDLVGELQLVFRLAGRPLSDNRLGPRTALRQLLLLTTGEIGLAAGLPRDYAMEIINGANAESADDVIPIQERLAKLAEHKDPHLHAVMIVGIGISHFHKGRIDEALDFAKRGKELGARIGDEEAKRTSIALSELLLQRITLSQILTAAIDMAVAAGLSREEALNLKKDAQTCDFDDAVALLESLVKVLELADPRGYADLVGAIGYLYLEKGQPKQALECANRAKEISGKIGDEKAKRTAIAQSQLLFQTIRARCNESKESTD